MRDPLDPRDLRDPRVRVRVLRGDARETAYEADYQTLLTGGSPPLADGDVLLVETLYERGVYVWGAVRSPGYFEVGPDVDAVRLLALAGGPQGDGARAEQVVTDATVAIIRPGAGIVYQASLEEFVIGTDLPSLVTATPPVDVVATPLHVPRGLAVAGSIVTLAFVVYQIASSIGGN